MTYGSFSSGNGDGTMFATVIRAVFTGPYSIHKCLASRVAEAVGVGCLVAKWEKSG